MSRLFFAALAGLCLAASAPAQFVVISAPEAIERSIASPDEPVGPFWVEMDVCGTGIVGGRVFLNSMADYRDRRSLNAFIPRWRRESVAERLGGDPADVLLGYRIQVYGAPRQARINLVDENRESTGEFYYQTHLPVTGSGDVRILHRDGEPVRADCGAPVS